MIVTVTPNTTIDLTVFIPELVPDTTIRATRTVQSMGGKPTDASWILGEMGIPSLALGFSGGATGDKVAALLRARGATTDFTTADGDTRTNVIIIDEANKTHTTITTTTMSIAPAHLDALRIRYTAALDEASVVVLGGTLPKGVEPSFYTEFIGLARARGVPVVFDAAEPNLSAGLAAGPSYIKPNEHELGQLVGRKIDTLADAYAAGREVIARYGVQPIITLGSDGALAVLHDRAIFAPPLDVPVMSPAGAGDAVLAGIAASIHLGQPVEEGLRLGVAAATAVVMMPGTADCRREDVERFLPQVRLVAYP